MSDLTELKLWMVEIAAEAVVVDPVEINNEARRNCWSFGPVVGAGVSEWRAFVDGVVDAREVRLREMGAGVGGMRFYCWHDEQAGQLRFSMVSISHGSLPFGVETVAAELDDVIRSFLGPAHEPYFPLQVWSVALPSGASKLGAQARRP